jgi:hypothetical protein
MVMQQSGSLLFIWRAKEARGYDRVVDCLSYRPEQARKSGSVPEMVMSSQLLIEQLVASSNLCGKLTQG